MEPATIKNGALAFIAVSGGMFANALGGWDVLLKVLVGMIAADYLTGLLIAAVWKKSNKSATGTLDSKASFRGLVKKCVILLLVYVAVLLDAAVNTVYIRSAVIVFYIGNEGISLLENLCVMGVPHPMFLEKVLQVLLEHGDRGEEK